MNFSIENILLSMVYLKNNLINPPIVFYSEESLKKKNYIIFERLLKDNDIPSYYFKFSEDRKNNKPIDNLTNKLPIYNWKLQLDVSDIEIKETNYCISDKSEDGYIHYHKIKYGDTTENINDFLFEIKMIQNADKNIIHNDIEFLFKCLIFSPYNSQGLETSVSFHTSFQNRIIMDRFLFQRKKEINWDIYEKVIFISEINIIHDLQSVCRKYPNYCFIITFFDPQDIENTFTIINPIDLTKIISKLNLIIGCKNSYYLNNLLPMLKNKIIMIYYNDEYFPSIWNDKLSSIIWKRKYIENVLIDIFKNIFDGEINSRLYFLGSLNTHFIIMQNDGNLVIYDQYHRPKWASNTHLNIKNYSCFIEENKVVIYDDIEIPIYSIEKNTFLNILKNYNIMLL